MAASKRPATRTESTCTTETARGTHAFRIVGYSLQRGIGPGKFVRSANFAVGGFDWAILFYPDGDRSKDDEGYVSLYLKLESKHAEVRALYAFRLLDQSSGLSPLLFSTSMVRIFRSVDVSDNPTWGIPRFIKSTVLQASPYLRDDCLVIECDVTVIKESKVVETMQIQVPPPDLLDNLGRLLESEEIAGDVTFEVKGEVFRAHKVVLAMRSPVFKAELYGPMRDKERHSIIIEDMDPSVFKGLRHFIYTDSLPSMDNLNRDEKKEMVKHLLVAADIYGVERMKLVCERILCERLDVESVVSTLALADQYHCSKLKDACIGFVNTSNGMDHVLASQGYETLKRACPSVFMDIFEQAAKSRKI